MIDHKQTTKQSKQITNQLSINRSTHATKKKVVGHNGGEVCPDALAAFARDVTEQSYGGIVNVPGTKARARAARFTATRQRTLRKINPAAADGGGDDDDMGGDDLSLAVVQQKQRTERAKELLRNRMQASLVYATPFVLKLHAGGIFRVRELTRVVLDEWGFAPAAPGDAGYEGGPDATESVLAHNPTRHTVSALHEATIREGRME